MRRAERLVYRKDSDVPRPVDVRKSEREENGREMADSGARLGYLHRLECL